LVLVSYHCRWPLATEILKKETELPAVLETELGLRSECLWLHAFMPTTVVVMPCVMPLVDMVST
jgi:hypothetical protein